MRKELRGTCSNKDNCWFYRVGGAKRQVNGKLKHKHTYNTKYIRRLWFFQPIFRMYDIIVHAHTCLNQHIKNFSHKSHSTVAFRMLSVMFIIFATIALTTTTIIITTTVIIIQFMRSFMIHCFYFIKYYRNYLSQTYHA